MISLEASLFLAQLCGILEGTPPIGEGGGGSSSTRPLDGKSDLRATDKGHDFTSINDLPSTLNSFQYHQAMTA